MYYLFRYHNVMPSQFYEMKFGEKQIVHAFMHKEIDERNEEAKALSGRGF